LKGFGARFWWAASYAAMIITYAQGLAVLTAGSNKFAYHLAVVDAGARRLGGGSAQ